MNRIKETHANKTTKRIPKIEPTYDYVFGYLEEQKPFSPQMIKYVVSNYEISLKKGSKINFLSRFFSFKPKEKLRYIIIGRKYNDLIRGLPKEEVLVIGSSWRDWLYCLFHRIPFRLGLPVMKAALDCYVGQKLNLISEVQEILKCGTDTTPKFIILFNDSLPVERIYCLLAKSLGMHSVCIQHGVFQANSPARIYDGGIADLMLAFDRHQFELMADGGIPKNKLGVVGFHSNIKHYDNLSYGLARRVCILGQPWGVYYPEIEVRYHELLENLNAILSTSGFKFVFKPHPSECDAHYLGKYGVVEAAKLKECLTRYDVFISFTSTALIEASLAGRIAIQIFDPAFLADRFSDNGYAYSIDSNDLSQLSKLVSEASPININNLGTINSRFQAAIRSHCF